MPFPNNTFSIISNKLYDGDDDDVSTYGWSSGMNYEVFQWNAKNLNKKMIYHKYHFLI